MKKYFEKVWFILGKSRNELPSLIIILILSSVTETFGISLLGPFFSIAIDPQKAKDIPFSSDLYRIIGINSDLYLIVILGGGIALVFCVKGLLYFLSKYHILRFSYRHMKFIIEKLNRSYLYNEYIFFVYKNSANLMKNIVVETQNFNTNVLLSLLYGISNLLILILLLILLAITNLQLLIVTITSFLPILIILLAMKTKLKKWGVELSVTKQNMIKILNHGLGGLKETKVLGCESYFETQMEFEASRFTRIAPLVKSFQMLPRIMIESSIIIFIIAYIILINIFSPELAGTIVSSMSIFAVASIRLLPAASQVMNALSNLPSSKHTVDVLYADLKDIEIYSKRNQNLLESAKYRKNNFRSSKTIVFKQKINLSNICYSYPNSERTAVSEISLDIEKGQSIALIGKSGSGKTTLADIILGLLIPQSGDITVDGNSIYPNLRDWQELLGYIPQSIYLLDDTVERNIAFGVSDNRIDDQKLERAIRAAQLEELITTLPRGEKTRIGERGVMLSGGQRQRIGIARALYHEREVLILDEATSALDNKTEQLVSESIKSLSGKKTVIIIAHRLSTVEHCDRVYLLDEGKLIKTGKFTEVINS